ncbi:MAG: histidine kinase, partial [Bacilli bacterium]|nr:histidine kinase [Bacilli bacterium]
AIIVQNILAGYAIAYVSLLLAIEILFVFLNVEKNIKLKEEQEKLKDANVKIMVSQIQPHFTYNTLSSISTLIPIDPEKAQKALDDFTDYLRMNFSTLTATKQVPFEDELKHIKTYANLEKLRFNERLNVIYDIKVTNFFVPPLSIQPLVENAIKHGILKKFEGGTVTLKTYEDENSYIVEVIDDGVGFDMEKVDFDDNVHIGLNNVKHRIITMSNGDIKFESVPNKGTKVVVHLLK